MRIIIADDHLIFREGLKLLLASSTDYQLVAEAADAAALKPLIAQHQPDLLIMDYLMPGADSGAVLGYLRQRYPALRIIVLTAERSGSLLRNLLDAGADAILLKEGSSADMLDAIRRVSQGQRYLPERVQALIDDAAVHLTARELQVIKLICAGWSNAAIAESFSLSPRTVDKHRENILRKLGVSNAVQLINKARSLGLLGAEHGAPGA
ncbi:response regulator transcription factor [Uliginosibacterium sediminicola]|uniref:Response regulator transcription factor n=1 Tax=Uliginosibacterium sediminicola TaxID=2024550 RepID=A0ABU9Z2H9_9RHOO